jgi:hypothetical protein
MPSTLFHASVGGLLAAALLGDDFDRRAALVVAAAVVVPELDAFLGLWIPGAHRTYTNNVFLPLALAAFVYYDTAIRGRSLLVERFGADAPRLAWVGIVVLSVAGIGIDLFYNGVNLFFPVVDRFYSFDGSVLLSNQRGLVQTIFDAQEASKGTTRTLHYSTAVDPSPGREPANVERVVPLASSGTQFLLTVTGFAVVAYRLWENR